MSMDPAFPTTAGWRPHPRYPDPAITALDPRFEQYWLKQSAVERLYTGCRWAEGPVWFGDGRYLLWSDIPNNRVLKWEEATGGGVPIAVCPVRQYPGRPGWVRPGRPGWLSAYGS